MLIIIHKGPPSVSWADSEKDYLFLSHGSLNWQAVWSQAGKSRSRQSCDGITPAEIKNSVAPQVNILADSALQTLAQEVLG